MRNVKSNPAGRDVHIWSDRWRLMVSKWHKMLGGVKISFTDGPRPDRTQKEEPPRFGLLERWIESIFQIKSILRG
jgi:hypothetical protein